MALPEPREVDLVAEPISAWRMWSLVPPPDTLTLSRETLAKMAASHEHGENPFVGLMPGTRLGPVGVSAEPWEPGENKARCAASSLPASLLLTLGPPAPPQHEAPWPECACGFWAFPTQKALAEHFASGMAMPCAFGEVQLWGRIAEFEKGYRAQYARPVRIWLVGATEAQRAEIIDYYSGCEVLEADDLPGRAEAERRMREEAPAGSSSHFTLTASPFTNAVSGSGYVSFDFGGQPKPKRIARVLKVLAVPFAVAGTLPMMFLSFPWIIWEIATDNFGDLPLDRYFDWCEAKGIL